MMRLMAKKKPSPWPKKLKELRELWGSDGKAMTQDEAAAKIFVTRRTWIYWEAGERTPSATVAMLIDKLISEAKK